MTASRFGWDTTRYINSDDWDQSVKTRMKIEGDDDASFCKDEFKGWKLKWQHLVELLI